MNTGPDSIPSQGGLITTLAVDPTGESCYALEGPIFVAGAAIQWLRDELGIIGRSSDSEEAALSVDDNGGVYLVPAFVGLGAPHWKMEARGVIAGLTRGSNRNHIIRAALESMAYQTHDVLLAMEQETGLKTEKLVVDGGAAQNNFLLQFQSDIINRPVVRAALTESTSLGVAYMAGLKTGLWRDSRDLIRLKTYDREFTPLMDDDRRQALLRGWWRALRQATLA
jgi:glycerol kinase